jgi:hypothetical protein
MAKIMITQKKQLFKIYLDSNYRIQLFAFLIIQLLLLNIFSSIAIASMVDVSEPLVGYRNQPSSSSRGRVSDWDVKGLWNDKEELNAIAIGDVDHTHPGDEVVVAGNSNLVTVLSGFGNNWNSTMVYEDDWLITAVAIGDVYPRHPGNEIVIVGWSTYVTMIYKSVETNNWVSERLYHDTDWLYDVAIGDLDPTHPGNEIVWSGDPRYLRMLSYSENTSSWSSKNLWGLTPADINVITIGDFNATHPGYECAVAGVLVNKINLTEVFYNNFTGKWDVHDMGKLEKDPLEMVAGDFYSGHPGDELALVSIQRNVMMIYQDSIQNAWHKEKLWQDTESIRDIAITNIVPEHQGNELVVVGYSNSATLITEAAGGWNHSTIFRGGTNLNGLAIGEFDAFHSGLELAVLQSTGKLLKVQPKVDGFNLFTPQSRYLIPAGNSIHVPIILVQEGDFLDKVTLQVENEDDLSALGITTNLHTTSLKPPMVTELLLTVSETTPVKDYELKIKGSATEFNNENPLNFTLSVLPRTTSAFNLTIKPAMASVVADFSADFEVKLNKINSWEDIIKFDVRYLPPGMVYSFIDQTGTSPLINRLTLTTTSGTPRGRNFIIVTAVSELDSRFRYSSVITLDVLEPEPDFVLEVEPVEVQLRINGSSHLMIHGFSYFGFNEDISFSFSGLPDGVDAQLEPETFIPTGNASVTLSSTQNTELRKYNVTIISTSNKTKIEHNISFSLIMLPELPSFKLDLENTDGLRVFANDIAALQLNLTPIAGFSGEVNISIKGLTYTMTWNNDISSINLTAQQTVSIEISGLKHPGVYDLAIVVQNGTQTKELDIQLEVLPKIKSDGDSEDTYDLFQVLMLIIILIIILIFVSKLTKRTRPTEPKLKKDHEKPQKDDEKSNNK